MTGQTSNARPGAVWSGTSCRRHCTGRLLQKTSLDGDIRAPVRHGLPGPFGWRKFCCMCHMTTFLLAWFGLRGECRPFPQNNGQTSFAIYCALLRLFDVACMHGLQPGDDLSTADQWRQMGSIQRVSHCQLAQMAWGKIAETMLMTVSMPLSRRSVRPWPPLSTSIMLGGNIAEGV